MNKINIIHGYSPYYFSKFSLLIKKVEGIPFIYEKRGFSELTNLVEGQYSKASPIYKWDFYNEQKLLRNADKVVTLSNQMKNELIKMGINQNKIEIIYNCVNLNQFKPKEPDQNILNTYNLQNKRIIGYVGNIRKLEGIDYLIKTFSKISNKFKNLFLLLVGNITNELKLELQLLIHKLEIKDRVLFISVVPYNKIINFYTIFEIIIIPRINTKVCNLVIPQKPIEIMAMEKLLLVSDVKGLTEIVKPGISGDIFKSESVEDLADKISFYLENPESRKEIEVKSRNYISENFTCNIQYKKYIDIYESLI